LNLRTTCIAWPLAVVLLLITMPAVAQVDAPPAASTESTKTEGSLDLLEAVKARGSISRLFLRSSESFSGGRVDTPVVVLAGARSGPTLCVVAGIHGDEVNGVEVVRRTVGTVSPASLSGTLIAIPIANMSAFRRGSRYLPDRRDLNRYFPGRIFGSSASRIAYLIFDEVIRHCNALVDLHTGSFHRSNLHQLRADLSDRATMQLAADFGAKVVVNNEGRVGTLRRAATDAGIPTITVEAGEPTRFDEAHITKAFGGLQRLLHARGMIANPLVEPNQTQAVAYLRTRWVRTDHGGILVSRVALGDMVETGQILGTVSDPLSDEVEAVISPISGRLLGMAVDQVVMPGFATYHLGFDSIPVADSALAPVAEPNPLNAIYPEGLDLEERPE
jgi:predicted deacylase